jgi:hypothetical protein
MRNDHQDETNGPRHDPRDREIDDALMQALRAEDPGAAFTQRVLARAREERAAQQSGRPLHAIAMEQTAATPAASASSASASASASAEVEAGVSARPSGRPMQRFTATRKLIAAIAASLTLAAVGEQWMQHRRYVAEGERARAQVLAALRLTNQKLNIVHDQITGREHAR